MFKCPKPKNSYFRLSVVMVAIRVVFRLFELEIDVNPA